MKSRQPAPENSLAIAMIELDRLERERLDIENQRAELRATAARQAREIRELGQAFRSAWPRAIARQRRKASVEHRHSVEHQRRLGSEMQREHAERMAELTRQNTERRAALARLEHEVVAEFHPARAALAWLMPFAAAGLVAAVAFGIVHQHPVATELAPEPAPMAAVAEPIVDASDEAPLIVSDTSTPVVDEPILVPEPSTKPIAKHVGKHEKPKPVVKPVVIKPNPKPIVLGDGEDPLGNLR